MPDLVLVIINIPITVIILSCWLVVMTDRYKRDIIGPLICFTFFSVILWAWFGLASLAPKKIYETKICNIAKLDGRQFITYKDYWDNERIVNLNKELGEYIEAPTVKVEIYNPYNYGMLLIIGSEPKIIVNENKGAKP